MEIIILLCLIFLNGLFVMSEIALVSARKPRLETQAEKGDLKARRALDLSNNPEIFLSAVIILFAVTFILSFVMLVFKKQFAAILFDSPSYIKFIFPLILMIAGMTIHAAVYGYYRGLRMMKKANLIQLLMMGIIPVFAISFAAGVAQSFIITGVLWIIISFLFLTGIIFGLAPAFASSSIDLNSALKESSGMREAGSRRSRLRNSLVVAEVVRIDGESC